MRELIIDVLPEEPLMSVGLSQQPSGENNNNNNNLFMKLKWNMMKVIMLCHTSEIGSFLILKADAHGI